MRSLSTEATLLSGVGRGRSPTSGQLTRSLRRIKSISISASASPTQRRAGSLPLVTRFESTTYGSDDAVVRKWRIPAGLGEHSNLAEQPTADVRRQPYPDSFTQAGTSAPISLAPFSQ